MTSASTPKFQATELGYGLTIPETVPARPDLPKGTPIGRYVLYGVLGRGGMGVVYSAHDPNLDRKVAIKILHGAHTSAGAERLIQEAQALAKLSDPHVVAVYDADELDGRVFLVMQLVDGDDLSIAIARRQPSPSQIVAWFVTAGRGLAAAHAAGLVHRDFKASNVLIDRRGNVAVTDFGVARDLNAEIPTGERTVSGGLIGTPRYMSPEQFEAQPATAQSDQFSFCVALWEALFGSHPYVSNDEPITSPLVYAMAIADRPLAAPPRGHSVPRQVIDILTRGLSRDPAARWSSMSALLAVLAPPPKRRIWPYLAAATLAAIAGGAIVFFASRGAREPDCAAVASDRVHTAWSADRATALAARFAKSGRSNAAEMTTQATSALDRYSARWSDLAADVCTTERANTSVELASRRERCLDGRLEATRTLVEILAGEDHVLFVDRAVAMINGLPDLGDCADAASLMAGPGAPPPAITAAVGAFEAELDALQARWVAGALPDAEPEFRSMVARADALGWPPAQTDARLKYGAVAIDQQLPTASAGLIAAAEIATRHRLDRDAVRAWSDATRAFGFERSGPAMEVAQKVARATAERVGDPVLRLESDIAYGMALTRLHQWKAAETQCRAAMAEAEAKLPATSDVLKRAHDCVFGVLVPLGRWSELEAMIEKLIAETSRLYGADSSMVESYYNVRATILTSQGKLAEARAVATRVLANRRKLYPADSINIAEALELISGVDEADGHYDAAISDAKEALAIADRSHPTQTTLIANLHFELGKIAAMTDQHADAVRELGLAIAESRTHGNDPLEVSRSLLVFGQIVAADDIDQAIAALTEAGDLLDHAGDNRAALAHAALAMLYVNTERWTAAVPLLEKSLADADPKDTDPNNLALMRFSLARALIQTHGDHRRAKELATLAHSWLVTVPTAQKVAGEIELWLAKHRS